MRATVIHGPGDVRLEDRPDPTIQSLGDAVVQVVRTCVCGSDLWPYRGIQQTTAPHPIGHEFTGVVEATGAEVSTVQVGDFVIAPFTGSGGTCVHCRNGITNSCVSVSGAIPARTVRRSTAPRANTSRSPTAPWSRCRGRPTRSCTRTC